MLGLCFSRFAGYKAGACKQAEQVVVTLKVLIGAVPTCMILTGLCILMVGPGPKVPSQDTSRQLSLRRWAPPAHGYTQQSYQHPRRHIEGCRRKTNQSTGLPAVLTPLNSPAFGDSAVASVAPSPFSSAARSPSLITSWMVVWEGSLVTPIPFALQNPRHLLHLFDLQQLLCLLAPPPNPTTPPPYFLQVPDPHICLSFGYLHLMSHNHGSQS